VGIGIETDGAKGRDPGHLEERSRDHLPEVLRTDKE
jgi:hypothetical protein